jgi:hypothetical protein
VLAATILVLLVDASSTRWSVARQNLGSLVGRGGCGLGDEFGASVLARISDRGARTLSAPSIATYFPCATMPQIRDDRVELPGYAIADLGASHAVFRAKSPFAADSDLYDVRAIARLRGRTRVAIRQIEGRIPGFIRSDAPAKHPR